jgi:hypothetical protein
MTDALPAAAEVVGSPSSAIAPTTNILALPLATASISIANTEDWIDAFKWIVGADPNGPQLDLGGIEFELEIRRAPPDNEVILKASTDDGSLSKALPPDVGFLFINVSHEVMQRLWAGQYVGDVIAKADGYWRRCLVLDPVEIVQGVTR